MIRRVIMRLLVAASIALPLVVAGVTQAASSTSTVGGNALKVSPVRNDLVIQPGSSQTIDVFVQNLTNAPANLEALVNDFTAGANENGEPNILLNGQEAPTHSLKQFVAPVSPFVLAPNAQKDVKVTIAIPKGTAGGGYYGLVRFAPAANSGANNVNLSASVGSLILVKVPGNITEQVAVASFDVRKNDHSGTIFASGKSLDAVVRFQNQGNVQETPFGKIVLKKGGKQVALYEINNADQPGNVLPGSIRRFMVPLTKIGSIGKYTIEGNFGYGNNGQLLSASKTFYIVPVAAIIVGIVALALIAFAIFGLPRLIRSYNRKVIEKASRKRR